MVCYATRSSPTPASQVTLIFRHVAVHHFSSPIFCLNQLPPSTWIYLIDHPLYTSWGPFSKEWSNYMYGPYGLYGPYGPYGPLRALRALYGPFTGPIRALRDLRASNSPETDFTWILPGFFGTKTSPYMLKSFLFSSRYTGLRNPPSAKVENFMWTISGPLRHFTVPNQKKFR